MRLSSAAFMLCVWRRSRAFTTYVPTPPSASAPAATPSSIVTCSCTRAVIASTLMPALTRPTIRPSSVTGVTARTDGPSVPV